jgi:hypothetical protein
MDVDVHLFAFPSRFDSTPVPHHFCVCPPSIYSFAFYYASKKKPLVYISLAFGGKHTFTNTPPQKIQ